MDGELKHMSNFVSKLIMFMTEQEQREHHDANHLVSLGSDHDDEGDGLSGGENNMDIATMPRRKKRCYQRLTLQQIHVLQDTFEASPYPDVKLKQELSNKLNMPERQVKFWFQNRRSQMKASMNQHENDLLQKENEQLREENTTYKKRMINLTCPTCGLPLCPMEVAHKHHRLLTENAWLKDEIKRQYVIGSKLIPRAMSPLLSSPYSLIAPGSNLHSNGMLVPNPLLPSSSQQPAAPAFLGASLPIFRSVNGCANDDYAERNMLLDHANHAMDEFTRLAQVKEPLWLPNMDVMGLEALNYEKYHGTFSSRLLVPRPVGFMVDATRDVALVMGGCVDIVDGLMDVHHWSEMFPGIVARARTTNVISSGLSASHDGLVQLMHAELQVMSPVVPIRKVTFLRYSKLQAEGLWAVVDVSTDGVLPAESSIAQLNVQTGGTAAAERMGIRLLPSGCLIQDMNNGYSKVTWVVHAAYDETVTPMLYRPLLRSGKAIGACRWLSSLQRQSHFLASLRNSIPGCDNAVTEQLRRRSVLNLVQRMTTSFTAICASVTKVWPRAGERETNNARGDRLDNATHITSRMIGGAPGEPTGRVLSATASVWLPGVKTRRVFDYMRDEQCLSEWGCLVADALPQGNDNQRRGNWDIPMNGEAVQKSCRIVEGLHQGHAISLISPKVMIGKISSTLILQETQIDPSGSLIVYAPTDVHTMHAVMNGSVDPASVYLLPSGCAILPDCQDTAPMLPPTADQASCSSAATTGGGNIHGSFVTVTHQILVGSLTDPGLAEEAVNNACNTLKSAIDRIKVSLQTNMIPA